MFQTQGRTLNNKMVIARSEIHCWNYNMEKGGDPVMQLPTEIQFLMPRQAKLLKKANKFWAATNTTNGPAAAKWAFSTDGWKAV